MRLRPGLFLVLLAILTLSCSLLTPATSVPPAPLPTEELPQPTSQPTLTPSATAPEPTLAPTSSNAQCFPSSANPTLASVVYSEEPAAIQAFLNAGGTPERLQQVLNQAGIANQPVAVASANMTGNGKTDVVVSIFDPSSQMMPPSGNLLIYICQGTQYHLAINQPTPKNQGGPHLWYLQDLNADGRADLVMSTATCGAHTCFEDVQILSWDGSTFINRLQGSTADLPYPVIKISDPKGNGIYQLEVTGTGAGSVGAGPPRNVTWVWMYDPTSQVWRKASEILGESNYRIHVLQDADNAAAKGDYSQALVLYQRVVSDPSLQDWVDPSLEQANLGAYARFKMLVVYQILGQNDFAQTTYQDLAGKYPPGSPQHDFVAMADVFRQAFPQGGAAAGCAAVTQFVDAHAEQVLAPLNAFGYGNPSYTAVEICPFK